MPPSSTAPTWATGWRLPLRSRWPDHRRRRRPASARAGRRPAAGSRAVEADRSTQRAERVHVHVATLVGHGESGVDRAHAHLVGGGEPHQHVEGAEHLDVLRADLGEVGPTISGGIVNPMSLRNSDQISVEPRTAYWPSSTSATTAVLPWNSGWAWRAASMRGLHLGDDGVGQRRAAERLAHVALGVLPRGARVLGFAGWLRDGRGDTRRQLVVLLAHPRGPDDEVGLEGGDLFEVDGEELGAADLLRLGAAVGLDRPLEADRTVLVPRHHADGHDAERQHRILVVVADGHHALRRRRHDGRAVGVVDGDREGVGRRPGGRRGVRLGGSRRWSSSVSTRRRRRSTPRRRARWRARR